MRALRNNLLYHIVSVISLCLSVLTASVVFLYNNSIYYMLDLKTFSLFFLITTFACGCCLQDPAYNGITAPNQETKWTPLCTTKCPKKVNEPLPLIPNTPLSTGDLVDIALRNNPLTRQSWNLARAAAFNVRISEAPLYPSIDSQEVLAFNEVSPTGNGSAINNSNTINGGIGAASAGAVGATGAAALGTRTLPGYTQTMTHRLILSYLMLDFGGLNASIEGARQGLLVANWTHNRTIQTVMQTVLTAYYNYVSQKALLVAREEDLKDSKVNLEAAKSRYESGVAAKLDFLLAESNFVNAELLVETTKGQVNITLGQLATALGFPANAKFQVVDLPEKLPLDAISIDMEQLLDLAIEERPDLAAAYSNYLEAEQLIIQVKSSGYPVITANAEWQKTDYIHQPFFNNRFNTGNISMNFPIFSGFLYRNEELNAKANAAAAYDAWLNYKENVPLDVVTSYNSYLIAVETVKFSNEYLEYSTEAYNVALGSYQAGVGSFLDLLTAQTTLSHARAQLIQAKTQLFTAVVNVAYSTGTL